MKAITVRDANGVLIAFGPAEGGYDPGVPAGATKQIEGDYALVKKEYADNYVPPVDEKVILLQRISDLEARLAKTETDVKAIKDVKA